MSAKTSHRETQPITFTGRKLTAMRVLWIALAGISAALFIAAFPIYWAQNQALTGIVLDQGWVTTWSRPDLIITLAEMGLSPTVYTGLLMGGDLLRVTIFVTVGFLIFLRRSHEWIGWFTGLFLILFGPMASSVMRAVTLVEARLPWEFIVEAGNSITWTMFYVFMVIFPDGRPAPHWMRFAVVGYMIGLPAMILTTEVTTSPYALVLIIVLISLSIYSQTYRYLRVSGPVERVQTRWVVVGIITMMAVILFAIGLLPAIFPQVEEPGAAKILYSLFMGVPVPLAFALIPITLGIAILQYRLWDIDIIIRRTLIYSTLTTILGVIYFGLIVLTQGAFLALTGQESTLAVVMTTLVIAALFRPVRARVQTFIDRRFFRRKYDAAQVLSNFANAVRDEIDVEDVEDALLHAINETMQPESVGLWLREAGKS